MEFIALVLAIAALIAFRTLNKRTLALEERLSETSDALIALRASLGQNAPSSAPSDDQLMAPPHPCPQGAGKRGPRSVSIRQVQASKSSSKVATAAARRGAFAPHPNRGDPGPPPFLRFGVRCSVVAEGHQVKVPTGEAAPRPQ